MFEQMDDRANGYSNKHGVENAKCCIIVYVIFSSQSYILTHLLKSEPVLSGSWPYGCYAASRVWGQTSLVNRVLNFKSTYESSHESRVDLELILARNNPDNLLHPLLSALESGFRLSALKSGFRFSAKSTLGSCHEWILNSLCSSNTTRTFCINGCCHEGDLSQKVSLDQMLSRVHR